jgi:hypothetical protein
VTTKVGAAGAASPTRVMVVAGRTIWSAALVVFRDELENAGIWTFVNGPDSLSGFTARARDLCSGLLRGGCFAHTLVGGALRLGVLAAAIGAAGLGVVILLKSP